MSVLNVSQATPDGIAVASNHTLPEPRSPSSPRTLQMLQDAAAGCYTGSSSSARHRKLSFGRQATRSLRLPSAGYRAVSFGSPAGGARAVLAQRSGSDLRPAGRRPAELRCARGRGRAPQAGRRRAGAGSIVPAVHGMGRHGSCPRTGRRAEGPPGNRRPRRRLSRCSRHRPGRDCRPNPSHCCRCGRRPRRDPPGRCRFAALAAR